jgi:CcmD family protein
MLKKITGLLIFCLVFAQLGVAQMPAVEMADAMRQNGKIYVVVLVMAIIFLGVVFYLINLDKKISKIEKHKK